MCVCANVCARAAGGSTGTVEDDGVDAGVRDALDERTRIHIPQAHLSRIVDAHEVSAARTPCQPVASPHTDSYQSG